MPQNYFVKNPNSNIIINYILFEHVLRIGGLYKWLCTEYDFLSFLFRKAKTGSIQHLFRDDTAYKITMNILAEITGLHKNYWNGTNRIDLGFEITRPIRLTNYIDNNRLPFAITTIKTKNDIKLVADNPLAINHLAYTLNTYKNFRNLNPSDRGELVKIVEHLFSLNSLLTLIFINLKKEIAIIEPANIYIRKSWEPFLLKNKPIPKYTKHVDSALALMIKTLYNGSITCRYKETFEN